VLAAEMLKQQELRSKAVIEAEEKERIRIARELHDGIGQQLSAAKLNISGLKAAIKTTDPAEVTMLQNALDLLDESVKEVRTVSHSMMPNALIKSGLVSAVREFIHKISTSGNLKMNLEIIGLKERMEAQVENILFRVLQEVVNNIIKHAKASEVSIQFIKHEKELTILVEDNGIGFDVGKELNVTDAGIGLKNIASRVAFLNGEVIFDSYPGKGTTVTIEIPL
jgi:signal transduction histidine kinase